VTATEVMVPKRVPGCIVSWYHGRLDGGSWVCATLNQCRNLDREKFCLWCPVGVSGNYELPDLDKTVLGRSGSIIAVILYFVLLDTPGQWYTGNTARLGASNTQSSSSWYLEVGAALDA
jgi:hypothetical protein